MSEQKTAASLQEFLCVLQEHEVQTYSKFVCIESKKVFTEENFIPNENMKVHWNNGEPYYHIGCRVYACHKGKDKNLYQKKKYAEKRDAKACNEHYFTQRRNLAQPTKKLDCPVVIKVTRVLSLPKFKVDRITKWKKYKMAELIKKKVTDGEDINGENRYCFTLPAEDSHKNHVVGLTASVTETVDPKVRSKIKELVLQGKRNISVILAIVEQFVASDLGETNDMRSRFYPPRKCVRNIINNVKKDIRWSKIDVENVEIKRWRQKNAEVNNPTEKDDQNQYEQPAEENYSGSDLLETRKSKKKIYIAECNSIIRSLQSTMWLLNEDYLEKLKTDLRNTLNEASLHISTDKDTSLPLETKSSKHSTKKKRHISEYAELPKPAKKKIKRFGQAADAKKLQIKISS